MSNEVAERYGGGLFELAKENGTVGDKKLQAQNLLKALQKDPSFSTFLRAVKVTREEKRAVVDQAFRDVLDADMIRFLKLLIDKDRSYCLKDILKKYIELANVELGVQEATVYSAREIKDEDLERIRKALEKKTGKEIVLTNVIDPSLIAGIKVTVGNSVTDITTKRQIDSLKQALLKGGRA